MTILSYTENLTFTSGIPQSFQFIVQKPGVAPIAAVRITNDSSYVVQISGLNDQPSNQLSLSPGMVNVYGYTQTNGPLNISFPNATADGIQSGYLVFETSTIGLSDFPGSYPATSALSLIAISEADVTISGPVTVQTESSNPLDVTGTTTVTGPVTVETNAGNPLDITGATTITGPVTVETSSSNPLDVTGSTVDITGNVQVVNGSDVFLAQPQGILLATIPFTTTGGETGTFTLPPYVHCLRIIATGSFTTIRITGNTSGYEYTSGIGVGPASELQNVPIAPTVDPTVTYLIGSDNAASGTVYVEGTSDPAVVGIENAPGASISVISTRGDGIPFPLGTYMAQLNTTTVGGSQIVVPAPSSSQAILIASAFQAVNSGSGSGNARVFLSWNMGNGQQAPIVTACSGDAQSASFQFTVPTTGWLCSPGTNIEVSTANSANLSNAIATVIYDIVTP